MLTLFKFSTICRISNKPKCLIQSFILKHFWSKSYHYGIFILGFNSCEIVMYSALQTKSLIYVNISRGTRTRFCLSYSSPTFVIILVVVYLPSKSSKALSSTIRKGRREFFLINFTAAVNDVKISEGWISKPIFLNLSKSSLCDSFVVFVTNLMFKSVFLNLSKKRLSSKTGLWVVVK